MRTKHLLLLAICVVVLTACSQTQQVLQTYLSTAMEKDWTITLLVNGSGAGASMKVQQGPMPKCRNDEDGCMVFQHSEIGFITFDMSGNDTDWHMTQLKICKGKTPPNPLTLDCPLGANAFDFYIDNGGEVTIPSLLTGEINWNYSDTVKTFALHDRNILEEDYYYMVTACDGPLDSDNCIIADPPVDNKGLK